MYDVYIAAVYPNSDSNTIRLSKVDGLDRAAQGSHYSIIYMLC